jgi:hypothetical protein
MESKHQSPSNSALAASQAHLPILQAFRPQLYSAIASALGGALHAAWSPRRILCVAGGRTTARSLILWSQFGHAQPSAPKLRFSSSRQGVQRGALEGEGAVVSTSAERRSSCVGVGETRPRTTSDLQLERGANTPWYPHPLRTSPRIPALQSPGTESEYSVPVHGQRWPPDPDGTRHESP